MLKLLIKLSKMIPTNSITLYKKVDINYILNFSGDIAKAIQDPIVVLFFVLLIIILGLGLKNMLALSYIKRYIKKRGEK